MYLNLFKNLLKLCEDCILFLYKVSNSYPFLEDDFDLDVFGERKAVQNVKEKIKITDLSFGSVNEEQGNIIKGNHYI